MKTCKHPCCENECRRPVKEKRVYKIRAVAKKREVINQRYKLLKTPFLKQRTTCEIQSIECTGKATCVHHVRGRGKFLLDVSTWKASCIACNGRIENKTGEAIANNWKQSKHEPNYKRVK